MKALLINGSPLAMGNVTTAGMHLLDALNREGLETDQVQIYEDHLNPCNCCASCEMRGDGRCVNEDDGMNDLLDRMRASDVIILASPSYYGTCTGQLKMFLERAGYCLLTGDRGLTGKIGAAFSVQERDGGLNVYNELIDWMLRNGMTVVGSDPLPVLNARFPGDWESDEKGVRALDGMAERIVETLFR